jgi:hypothetical protein
VSAKCRLCVLLALLATGNHIHRTIMQGINMRSSTFRSRAMAKDDTSAPHNSKKVSKGGSSKQLEPLE